MAISSQSVELCVRVLTVNVFLVNRATAETYANNGQMPDVVVTIASNDNDFVIR